MTTTTLDKEHYGRQYVKVYCVKPEEEGPAVWGVRVWHKDERGVARIVDNDGQEHRYVLQDNGYGLDQHFQGVKFISFPYKEYVGKVGTTLENGEVVPVVNEHHLDRVAVQCVRDRVAATEFNVSMAEERLAEAMDELTRGHAHLAALKEWLMTKELSTTQ